MQGLQNAFLSQNDQSLSGEDFLLKEDALPSTSVAEEEEEKEAQEALKELETRKEEIVEEFLETAVKAKFEAVEEVKAQCRKDKKPKESEKKMVAEAQARCDKVKKEGLQQLTNMINSIISNDEISLEERVARMNDREQISAHILSLL